MAAEEAYKKCSLFGVMASWEKDTDELIRNEKVHICIQYGWVEKVLQR